MYSLRPAVLVLLPASIFFFLSIYDTLQAIETLRANQTFFSITDFNYSCIHHFLNPRLLGITKNLSFQPHLFPLHYIPLSGAGRGEGVL